MYYLILRIFNNLIAHKYFISFLNYCILQNIITIAILPLYGSWGISFSTLSLIGNCIFIPFLSLYLIFSIIILIGFCFQKWFLLIIHTQKYLIDIWIFLMYKLSIVIPYWIFTFVSAPSISYPLCWSFCLLLIFNKRIKKNIYYYFFYSFISLLFIMLLLYAMPPKNNFFIFEDFNRIYLIRLIKNNTVYIHIPNNKKNSISEKKIEYMLVPEIKKNFGITHPKIFML